ncbi:MAG TPA: hypothetical protein VFK80_11965, partial [Limnochordia bacterium]|nr:hypothetical protein [Limnochordia bacterium]
RSVPASIACHAVQSLGAQGGVHVRVDPTDARSTLIELYDPRGANVSRAVERKIEGAFFREDFRRAAPHEVGKLEFPDRVLEQHRRDFLKLLDTAAIRLRRPRIVIDGAFGRIAPLLPPILGELGCDAIYLNAHADFQRVPRSEAQRTDHLGRLGTTVATLGADFGVLLYDDGDRLAVVDESGQVVPDAKLLALFAKLALRRGDPKRTLVAVPVGGSNSIARIVEEAGGRLLQSPDDVRSLQHAAGAPDCAFAGDSRGGAIFPDFHPSSDGLMAAARLCEALTGGQSIAEMVAALPTFFLIEREVPCAWDQKGRVMRLLAEDEAVDPSCVDGVRFQHPEGWALALPASSEPHFRVVAEGRDRDSAEALLARYAERVLSLQTGAPPKASGQ